MTHLPRGSSLNGESFPQSPPNAFLRRIPSLLVAMSTAALLTCVDDATEPSLEPQLQSRAGGHQTSLLGEVEFNQIAAEVPAFAGFYYDDSTLVVLVNNSEARSAARLAVQNSFLQPGGALEDPGSIPQSWAVREVEFSFLQLRGWRDDALPALDSMTGVTFLDLDEVQNKVAVGVERSAQASKVRDALASLRIPSGAIHIEVTGPMVPLVSHESESSLTEGPEFHKTASSVAGPSPRSTGRTQLRGSVVRPVHGGFVIALKGGGRSPWTCTLGFNARAGLKKIFVTNSHCTNVRWKLDGTVAYQPAVAGDEYIVGNELKDPPATERCLVTKWYGPGYVDCRMADAASFEHTSDSSFEIGKIARTEWRSTGDSAGSIVIYADSPYFDIFSHVPHPWYGQGMEKMGMATGWTHGTVTRTCADRWQAKRRGRSEGRQRYKCQYLADAYSKRGDSGSPVFRWVWDGGVTLVGILWGGEDGRESWFSPFGGITSDLGSMRVLSETPPPPRPLRAYINGPDTVQVLEENTWRARVLGGTPPYSYEWSNLLEGTDATISGRLSVSGTLNLTVTDDNGDQKSTRLFVCVVTTRFGSRSECIRRQ